MKLNKRFFIQMLIAVALIASWCIYENLHDDKPQYDAVLNHSRTNQRVTDLVTRASDGLIQGAEAMVEKTPKQKPLVHIMKEMQEVIGNHYDFIGSIKSEVFEFDLNEIEKHKYEKPKIIMPIGYNSTERVRLVFKEHDTLDDFENNWEKTLSQLKELYAKSIRKSIDVEVLSDSTLNVFYKKQERAIRENTPLHQELIEQKELRNIILKYDVIHADALLTALQSELKSLEWILLYNTSALLKEETNSFAAMIIMDMEGTPQVGEPTKFAFYPSTYVNLDSMQIRLNGKLYETKNGIATFNYTPRSAGMKYFKVDISLKNPFTGKTDNFSDTKKVEVFE